MSWERDRYQYERPEPPPPPRCRPELELKHCKCGVLGTPFGIGPPQQHKHEAMCHACFKAHPFRLIREADVHAPFKAEPQRGTPKAVILLMRPPAKAAKPKGKPADTPSLDLFGGP